VSAPPATACGGLFGGYDFKLNQNNTLTPELGLSALWSHIPASNVEYNVLTPLNQSYTSQDYTAVYANAMLRWTGAFELGELMLQPRAMLGVRQTLSDGKIKSSMTFAGNQFNSSITDDRTVGLGQLAWTFP
jgi:Autotransporter beta-domain.